MLWCAEMISRALVRLRVCLPRESIRNRMIVVIIILVEDR
jgi:hypothetical protein